MENGKITVLVTETNDPTTTGCVKTMREHGMDVRIIEKNGNAVLQAIRQYRPNVVLMDLFMPQMDALGVLQAVQVSGEMRPRFLIMSSFDNPHLEREVMLSGADYYILKPFDAESVYRRIRGLCDRIRSVSTPHNGGESLEMRVTEILHQVGVPAHIKGYQYLRDAILMAIEEEDVINAVTKRLYPAVAKKNGTTSSRVERAIRHAIEVAWDRGDVDVFNAYFGYTIQSHRGKPTNSEFIAMISDKFRLQLKIS